MANVSSKKGLSRGVSATVLPITIRNYRKTDLDSCRALWVELTEWHRRIYNNRQIGGPRPGLVFDRHLKRVGSKNLWVAINDGAGDVVGLVGLIRWKHFAEIEPVVVSDRFRGAGVGRKLVKAMIQVARKEKFRQLRVRPAPRNGTAIRFFHRLGFDTLAHIELLLELKKQGVKWKRGPQLFDRSFRH